MKKYLILIILSSLVLTGCLGINGDGNLTSTCTKEEKSNIIDKKTTYVIDYKEGNINYITLTEEYSEDISNTLNTYKKAYENETGVEVSTTNNSITYKFDMNKVSKDIKDTFNLKDTYNGLTKSLESENYSCK